MVFGSRFPYGPSMRASFRVTPSIVAAWVLGGSVVGASDIVAGVLPAAPVPLQAQPLTVPGDAVAWSGSGPMLPDGSCAIGDLGRNRVVVQRADGSVVQTLTDPFAAAGEDRGFGAAVAIVGTDELLVFARSGPAPNPAPAIYSFRRSADDGAWQHSGTIRFGASAAVASPARNRTRIAVSPGERRYALLWEGATGVVWSVCEDFPGFGWFEQPLGNVALAAGTTEVDLSMRGGTVAALMTAANQFAVRFAAFDAAQQAWFAPYNAIFTSNLGSATGVAVNSAGEVLVASRQPGDRACTISQYALVAAHATFGRVAIRTLVRPSGAPGDAMGVALGASGDSMFLLSALPAAGELVVDELGDSVVEPPVLRRSFRAASREATSVSRRWGMDFSAGALNVLPAPATVLPAPSGVLLRRTGVDDLDGDGVPDRTQLERGKSPDCNRNGVPDAADLALGAAIDLDTDGVPDGCQADCDADGTADYASIVAGVADCNRNGVPDAACDVLDPALDVDGNGVVDACSGDCDANGVADDIDVFNGALSDCDSNGVPDSCQGYLAPDIGATGLGGYTAVRWQPVVAGSPVLNALTFRSTSNFAVARRLMIVRDRSGTGDRSQVAPDDVLHFVRLPSIVCPPDAAGDRLPVMLPLPQIDLSGVPAFWVAIESVTLGAAGVIAPGQGEPGHYVRASFPEVVAQPDAWMRNSSWLPSLQGLTPTFSVLSIPCVVPGDFDRDGRVGGTDLGLLVGAWGTGDILYDLDRNGIVAGGDLSILLASWSDR